jgi:hypothetical protein
MFNPVTPAQMVTALGRAARAAGRSQEPASDFSRGQLMSAYSATRHLAVELAEYPPELRRFADAMADLFDNVPATVDQERFADRARALRHTGEAWAIGNLVCEALDDLRGDAAPAAADLRARVQTAVHALSDREVQLLADVIEAPRT